MDDPRPASLHAATARRCSSGRPILAFVLNALIVIAGLAGLLGVDVRELPDVDSPVVTISTRYDGAAPETIDREVPR